MSVNHTLAIDLRKIYGNYESAGRKAAVQMLEND